VGGDQRLVLCKQVALGMFYLHKCTPAVLHLSLRSSNVMLDPHGVAKVGDFGLSVAKDELFATGSPQWTAPETLRGRAPQMSADVFSFAMVMYELVASALPYAGLEPNYVTVGLVTKMLPRPRLPADSEWPAEVLTLVRLCWDESPEARPSFGGVLDSLEPHAAPAEAALEVRGSEIAGRNTLAGKSFTQGRDSRKVELPAATSLSFASRRICGPGGRSAGSQLGLRTTGFTAVLPPPAEVPSPCERGESGGASPSGASDALHVGIPASGRMVDERGKPYTLYCVKVSLGAEAWSVTHRYREFARLHAALQQQVLFLPELPRGGAVRWLGRLDDLFVRQRRSHLEEYLRQLIANQQWLLAEYAQAPPTQREPHATCCHAATR
jgi:hypothetical protein